MTSIGLAERQRGFGLLMLAIVMILLGLTVAVVLALLPNRSDQERIDETIFTVEGARHELLGFVVGNGRLPEPDTDADGLENAGADTGALPYRSMGLPAAVLDEASIPLRYTPYRNDAASADLAAAEDLYAPDLPDTSDLADTLNRDQLVTLNEAFGFTSAIFGGLAGGAVSAAFFSPPSPEVPTIDDCSDDFAASPVNLLDFCTAVDNAIAAGASTDLVNVGPSGSNVAYAVLSGGLEDADGNAADRSLDGPNDDGDLSYEDPARGRGAGYDDIVRATRFSSLQRELSCRALVDSVNMLAVVAQSSKGILESTISSYKTAETQTMMAAVAVLMDAIAIAQTIQGGIGVAADIGKAGGGCASVVLSATCCPALAANIASAVVYAVALVAQIVKLALDAVALAESAQNRNLFREYIVPGANEHMCSAIAEAVAADARGGLTPVSRP